MPSPLNIVKNYWKIALIFIGIAIFFLFILYFLNNQKNGSKFRVINSSKYYSVEFQPTSKFVSTLNEWGIWDKNKIFLDKGRFTTLKSIEFEFTDKEQHYLIQYDKDHNILWSSGVSVKDGSTLVISTYINPRTLDSPSYSNNTDRNLDRVVISNIILLLYDSTHVRTQASLEVDKVNQKAITTDFGLHPETIPFRVQIKK